MTPPAPAPVVMIQKSDETSITTESPKDTAPSAPPPAQILADDDASSILISSSPSASSDIVVSSPEATPIIVTSEPTENENLISHIEVSSTPVTPTPSAPVINDLGNLFSSDIEVASTSPVIESNTDDVLMMDEVAPTLDAPEEVKNEGIFSFSEEASEETTLTEDTHTEAISEQTESIIATKTPESTPMNLIEESPIFGSDATDTASQDIYEHPSEFIAASIAKIDAMVTKIDATHSAKLEEALGYKTEKEKYTLLEETAYADAQKLIEEKDHALGMRSYFVEQGNRESGKKSEVSSEITEIKRTESSEITDSMETTLTGLAVQNVVTETVKAPKAKKEAAKTEEAE